MVATQNGAAKGFLQALVLGFRWIIKGGARRITGDEISGEAIYFGFRMRMLSEINEEDDC